MGEIEDRIEKIAEEYLDGLQKGEAPDRHAICSRQPDIAKSLSRRLRLVEMMVEAGTDLDPTRDLPSPEAEKRPEQIGPFRILERIGRGGMGVVYLADQTDPIRRRVALKLVKIGMDTEETLGRFETERQALAIMDHPNIAKVLDAGATDAGRPYFVMEYVPGVSISRYCDDNRLSTRRRLDLFLQVCDAVQHAHQKGIIHRDLKPSNILVTSSNGTPRPKIIDFGVAKATSQRFTEQTVYTEKGRIIGTPEYMSPEQADPLAPDVDTRSDIYTLGIVLYELLVGILPFDRSRMGEVGLNEIRRTIREEEAPRPSTRLSTLGEASTTIARRRDTNPTALSRLLRGDLDWITMKALEKDRTRRYATASELAADIRRFLANEPIEAGPPSLGYRLGKLVRRHRPAFVAAGVIAMVLLVSLASLLALYVKADRERAEKERQLRMGKELKANLERILTPRDPQGRWEYRDINLGIILEQAAQFLSESPSGYPEVDADLHRIISRTYRFFGQYEEARTHIDAALKIYDQEIGAVTEEYLTLKMERAIVVENLGHRKESERIIREVYEERLALLGPDHPATFDAIYGLSINLRYQHRYEECLEILEGVIPDSRRVLGDKEWQTLQFLQSLGMVHRALGNPEASEKALLEVLRSYRTFMDENAPEIALAKSSLALVYLDLGKAEDALLIFQETLELAETRFGENHRNTLVLRQYVARAILRKGDPAEAARILSDVIAGYDRRKDLSYPRALEARTYLAEALYRSDRAAEAEGVLTMGLSLSRTRSDLKHETFLLTWEMGRLLVDTGRPAEALPFLKEAVELADVLPSVTDREKMRLEGDHAAALVSKGELDVAEGLLKEALDHWDAEPAADPRSVDRILRALVNLYESGQTPEQAKPYRDRLDGGR